MTYRFLAWAFRTLIADVSVEDRHRLQGLFRELTEALVAAGVRGAIAGMQERDGGWG